MNAPWNAPISDRFSSLCSRIFSPAAAILESEKTLVTRLVSSYDAARFAFSKCNSGSISSFLICPPAVEHTLQRNIEENPRRGLKTNTKGSTCLQELKKKLGNYNKCEFSNFFLSQWPKVIISVLATWMIVDCNLSVRVVPSFKLCAVDHFKNARFYGSFADTELRSSKIRKV